MISESINKPQCHPKSTKQFVIDAMEKHGNRYNYSKFDYINSKIKGKIICLKHGEFFQTPDGHLSGKGCKKCGRELTENSRKIIPVKFIEKCKIKHGKKYDYSKTLYKGSHEFVDIICEKHGIFQQIAYSHLQGKGCPKCNNGITSKKENNFLDYLNIKNRNKKIGKFLVDGIDINNKIVYEFLGDYWHGNPEIYKCDEINRSNKECFGNLLQETYNRLNNIKNLGYNVKYIWERDWNNFINGKNKELVVQTL
jgi:hypothetical protein